LLYHLSHSRHFFIHILAQFLAYNDFDNTPNNGGRRKSWSLHVQDWRVGDPTWKGEKGKGIIGAINYLASKGLNVFSFLTFNVGGDDKNCFMYISSLNYTRIDVSKTAQWDVLFEHADSLGLYMHFKLSEIENSNTLDGGALGIQRKIYYREVIARYGHHLALNWNIGEENNNTDAQRKEFAQYFEAVDPYDHPVVGLMIHVLIVPTCSAVVPQCLIKLFLLSLNNRFYLFSTR
jgi:hypothetical protein